MIAALALCLLAGAGEDPPVLDDPVLDEALRARVLRMAPLGPPPPDPTNRVGDDPAAARLGQRLFFDASLSADGTVSCATCHDPAQAFADGREVAFGLAEGTRNTPSLVGAAHQRWLFHDGRADSLWAQSRHPLEDPREMGSSRLALARRVADEPTLRAEYTALFGPPPELEGGLPEHARPVPDDAEHPHARAWAALDADLRAELDRALANVGKALAAYERQLVPGTSPFDRYAAALAAGDPTGGGHLEPAAVRGLALFVGRADCRSCHSGPLLSDGAFHNLGLPARGGGAPRDPGRYTGSRAVAADPFRASGAHSDAPGSDAGRRVDALAHGPESWGAFRTPTLRGVARTAPYMHAGQLASLEDVVRYYSDLEGQVPGGHHQEQILAPLRLSAEEQSDLVAFLRALSGDGPAEDLRRPPDEP